MVKDFRYLGRILAGDDDDSLAAYARLRKARLVWGRFRTILQADGASPAVMGKFYRTVISATLLFGSETWVLSDRALLRLERFHRRCARGMAHRPFHRNMDGTWFHSPTADVLAECNLQPLHYYIRRRRTHIRKRYAEPSSALYKRCSDLETTTLRRPVWRKLDQ